MLAFNFKFFSNVHEIRLDKTLRSSLSSSTSSDNETSFKLEPNVDYDVKVVIENSIVVILC